jgi:hypothetical protein
VGIVVASIALLLSSRAIWLAALILGATCAGTLGVTFMQTRQAVEAGERRIKAASDNIQQIESDDDDDDPKKPEPVKAP